MGIRELTDDWSRLTYEEGCMIVEQNTTDIEEGVFKRLHYYLVKLNRYKFNKMVGETVQKLPSDPAAEAYNGIRFTEIFNRIKDDEDFNPDKYLANITQQCINNNLSEEFTLNLLGRGLRIFASFMREIDAEEQLESILTEREMEHELKRDPEMDVKGHTDIMVKMDDRCYRIWLFANTGSGNTKKRGNTEKSNSGIENTIERLEGKRGELPIGIHILCPMDPSKSGPNNEEINGWRFYKREYIEELVDKMFECQNKKFEEIKSYEEFKNNIDLTKEEIQIFEKKR